MGPDGKEVAFTLDPSFVKSEFFNIQFDESTKNLAKDIIFNVNQSFQSWDESFDLHFKVDQIEEIHYDWRGKQVENENRGLVGFQYQYENRNYATKQQFNQKPECDNNKNAIMGCSRLAIKFSFENNRRISNRVMT